MVQFGKELDLMLSKLKPLSVFYKYVGESFDEYGGQNFQKYVDDGEMRRMRFFITENQGKVIRYTLFFSPENCWRAELYRALKKSPGGWSQEKEQLERTLLGNAQL